MPADLREELQRALGAAYTFERELGGGGMSRVFLATETALGRHVVVKVLPPETAHTVSAERFKREIILAARLQHPNILPVLSAGQHGRLLYYTMPFVDGETLRTRLDRERELPVAEAVRLLGELADALAYAHGEGVVHRDLKPENVLLSRGHAVVADFGVAKAIVAATDGASNKPLTAAGMTLGTPEYMAPEQAAADPQVDHRADLYALGCLAFELLSGAPPFAHRTPQQTLAAQVREAPAPLEQRRPGVPRALARLVKQLLEKRPADRPQSAEEVQRTLDDVHFSTHITAVNALPDEPAATTSAVGSATDAGGRSATRRTAFAAGIIAAIAIAATVSYCGLR